MLLKIALCKGRPYNQAVQLLNRYGFRPELAQESSRCLQYREENVKYRDENLLCKYVQISPRDAPFLLRDGTVNMVVSYDDTFYHMTEKNYHLKPLLQIENNSCMSRICLVGKPGINLASKNLRVLTEYEDAQYFQSTFRDLNLVDPIFTETHGTTESLLVNDMADLGIMVVETGQTLAENNLQIYQEISTLSLNFWVNCDQQEGRDLIRLFNTPVKFIYIDGMDGSGKTTLINSLKKDGRLKKFIFRDRGILSDLTLKNRQDQLNTPVAFDENIILECCPEISLQRKTGQKLDPWESKNFLFYFRHKFRELAGMFGIPLIDTSQKSKKEVVNQVTNFLLTENWHDHPLRLPAVECYDQKQVDLLPIVTQGESKIIRRISDRFDLIEFIPSIYSHKSKRAGIIPGSDLERLKMTRAMLQLLALSGIPHNYWYVGTKYILAEKLVSSPPRVEVVVKSRWEGTDKYRYVGLNECKNRHTGENIVSPVDNEYPRPYVRFDWRNSNSHPDGDVALSESLADLLIDTEKAKRLALDTFSVLQRHLTTIGIQLWDICFFITQEGDRIFGEISQDNARYKKSGNSLDKDVWRTGNSADDVLEKWTILSTLVENYVAETILVEVRQLFS